MDAPARTAEGGVKMLGLKALYCSKRDCPNIMCDYNLQTIQMDKLPDWVIIRTRDYAGMFEFCPKKEGQK